MSVSSNSRKESTESNAAQQMHSTMGIHPDLAQLNDKNLDNDLPSRVADSSDLDGPNDTVSDELPTDAEDASTDGDSPMTAYQQPTKDGAMLTNRTDEPDRTLGNS